MFWKISNNSQTDRKIIHLHEQYLQISKNNKTINGQAGEQFSPINSNYYIHRYQIFDNEWKSEVRSKVSKASMQWKVLTQIK